MNNEQRYREALEKIAGEHFILGNRQKYSEQAMVTIAKEALSSEPEKCPDCGQLPDAIEHKILCLGDYEGSPTREPSQVESGKCRTILFGNPCGLPENHKIHQETTGLVRHPFVPSPEPIGEAKEGKP